MNNKLIKKVLYKTGAFRIFSLIRSSKFIPILMYHGFRIEEDRENLNNFNEKHLGSRLFQRQLELIKKYCTPISLVEAFSDKKLPRNPVVLTFDDGYRNNYTVAFSLLKEYQIPATIFVTTGFIDRTHFMWTDQLEYLVRCSNSKNIISLLNNSLNLTTDKVEESVNIVDFLKEKLKNSSDMERLAILELLENELGVEYGWDKVNFDLMPLSWNEIREMKNSGLVEIGSHTVSHPILSKCSYEKQLYELKTSKDRVSEELGDDCLMFAYPNGRTADYTHDTSTILKECGYKIALTTVPGYEDRFSLERFTLKRWGTGITIEEFVSLVSGFNLVAQKIRAKR